MDSVYIWTMLLITVLAKIKTIRHFQIYRGKMRTNTILIYIIEVKSKHALCYTESPVTGSENVMIHSQPPMSSPCTGNVTWPSNLPFPQSLTLDITVCRASQHCNVAIKRQVIILIILGYVTGTWNVYINKTINE